MSTLRPGFRIRPARFSDSIVMSKVYVDAISHDAFILDSLFPERLTQPEEFALRLKRFFWRRWWTPGWEVDVLVDERQTASVEDKESNKDQDNNKQIDADNKKQNNEGVVVGFAWWKRPASDLSFRERWLTPFAWFAPVMRLAIYITSLIRPTRAIPSAATHPLFRKIEALEEVHLTPSRPWFYLSLLAVSSSLQGTGLGSTLLRHGLDRIDAKADSTGIDTTPTEATNTPPDSDSKSKRASSHKNKTKTKNEAVSDSSSSQQSKASGSACYLVALKGLEPYYHRFGFTQVGRANTGELSAWEGGAFMVREP
ncbi:hypothetical protein CDD82_4409 [Ophiocordyceps australis]|uniref:N-acetyltransferase domain-containing protein n=1 Tax=Ophiocordyceps australis TaxID=1399860 RepID=A0A2C5Z119_9HYPO|nr:hypothetical protein CDD82_4409 [Ophiocordyceps australis]